MEKKERNTAQKRQIEEALAKLDHPSADEIYLEVRQTCPHVSRATVYRNVSERVERGELRRVNAANGADRFDPSLAPHYHGICRICGRVFDVSVPYLSEMDAQTDENFFIEGHEVVFKGVCKDCKNKNK